MAQRIEQQQEHAPQQVSVSTSGSSADVPPAVEATPMASDDPAIRRSSTPILSEEGEETCQADLSALESAFQVIIASESQRPELRDRTDPESANTSGAPSRTVDENASSICDAPALPGGAHQVHFLEGQSDEEKLQMRLAKSTLLPCMALIPFTLRTSSEVLILGTSKDPAPHTQPTQSRLSDLSGRSTATLKGYFDEAAPIRLPVGPSTVAFTESQIYHLLRVLTDETPNRSFSTMQRMVIDAVRGSPTVAPSPTAHFLSKGRCQTPMRRAPSDSSETESEKEGATAVARQPDSSSEGTGESSHYEESNRATEMDLLTQSFKKTTVPSQTPDEVQPSSSQQQKEPDLSEFSSQDTTLQELREQSRSTTSKSKKRKSDRRLTRRGVPMKEEFFSKKGWTRSFISGPADPVHNPLMVWCHICKKNFSIKSKGPYEILRHHRTQRHLRRDQRWRYEHLRSTDPVTGKVQPRVRRANGKILSKMELAKALPHFINEELVDIGERFLFYDDYIKGSTTALVTAESRAKTQLCLVGYFAKTQGDLMVLRNLWSRMGSFTNHQATVTDFDWGEERLTVSNAF